MKDDDGTRIQKLTGADNGDNDGEYWKVTTPDGVQYFFGRNNVAERQGQDRCDMDRTRLRRRRGEPVTRTADSPTPGASRPGAGTWTMSSTLTECRRLLLHARDQPLRP